MRISYEVPIEGRIYRGKTIRVTRGPFTCVLLRNKRGFLKAVRVEAKGVDPALVRAEVTAGSGDVASAITIDVDANLNNSLVSELQNLESNLPFSTRGSLRRFRWRELRQRFAAQTLRGGDGRL